MFELCSDSPLRLNGLLLCHAQTLMIRSAQRPWDITQQEGTLSTGGITGRQNISLDLHTTRRHTASVLGHNLAANLNPAYVFPSAICIYDTYLTPNLSKAEQQLHRRQNVNVYVTKRPKRITGHCDIISSHSQISAQSEQTEKQHDFPFGVAQHEASHINEL